MTSTLPLPASPDEVGPAWLTAVLWQAGVLRRASVAGLSWEPIGEERGFTGVVARLRLRYAGLGPGEDPPPSLVAKFPTAERTTPSAYRAAHQRDAAAARRHYERCAREARFYREIGPGSGLAVPRPYFAAADDESGRVVLLLEDLADARPGDALAGCSPAEAALVLEAVAPVHARWWGRLGPGVLPWLPPWGGDPAAHQERYAAEVGPFLTRHGHRLPPPVRDLVERLRTRYAAVLAALGRAPTTVVHADLHLDNVAFNPPGAAPPAVVLDWQGVGRPPKLDAAALALLEAALEAGLRAYGLPATVWSVRDLRAVLADRLGVRVCPTTVHRAIQRLGFRYRRPRHDLRHRQDAEAVAAAQDVLAWLRKKASTPPATFTSPTWTSARSTATLAWRRCGSGGGNR